MDNITCPFCGLENLEDYEETYVDEPKCPECGYDLTDWFDSFTAGYD